MPNKPKVSIILPTYNRAHSLERAVESVLQQSFRDLELIIVDDASKDNTQEVVHSIDDPRIIYIRHSHNQGGAAARNTGIKASIGSYIAFQDSDDEWLSGKLNAQVELLNKCDDSVGAIYTGFLRCNGRQALYIPLESDGTDEEKVLPNLLKGNFISTQTLLVRKEHLEKSEYFDERLPRFQDWELAIRLAKICSMKLIDKPMVVVHSTPGNITSNETVKLRALELIYNRHYMLFSQHPKEKALFLFNMGNIASADGDIMKGANYYTKAISTSPINFKFYIALFLTPLRKHLIKLRNKLKVVLT